MCLKLYLDPRVGAHNVVPQGQDARTLLPDDDEVLKYVDLHQRLLIYLFAVLETMMMMTTMMTMMMMMVMMMDDDG